MELVTRPPELCARSDNYSKQVCGSDSIKPRRRARVKRDLTSLARVEKVSGHRTLQAYSHLCFAPRKSSPRRHREHGDLYLRSSRFSWPRSDTDETRINSGRIRTSSSFLSSRSPWDCSQGRRRGTITQSVFHPCRSVAKISSVQNPLSVSPWCPSGSLL